jgi:hypothetical protein
LITETIYLRNFTSAQVGNIQSALTPASVRSHSRPYNGPVLATRPHRTLKNSDAFVDALSERGITPVIPPKTNRLTPRACDFALYCERNLVERFFNKLKQFRAIATRYDKLARNFLAGIQLASAIMLLN